VYELKITDNKSGKSNRVFAKQIVAAAGPYLGKLLESNAPKIADLIVPKRVALTFFKINERRFKSYTEEQKEKILDSFPVLDMGPDHIFAMVEKIADDGSPIIKIGGHFLRDDVSDLDEVWREKPGPCSIEWGRKCIFEYFNMLEIPIEMDELDYHDGYSCVYYMTKSEVALVTHLVNENGQANKNFVMIGGMSGVGAKGAMTYGLIGTNLLTEKDEPDFMYQEVKNAMGLTRLKLDLSKH
jgi:hypothetical protein